MAQVQLSLLELIPQFSGADYEPARDEERLITQYAAIVELMSDGEERTVDQALDALRKRYPHKEFPANSVQAQFRNMRKVGLRVDTRNIRKDEGGYLNAYRFVPTVQA